MQLFFRLARFGLLPALFSRGLLAAAAQTTRDDPDPCVKIAGLQFADPVDAIACLKSFPFDEALRQNVVSVVSRVFDFFTFEEFYLDSPPPFQESTMDIRAQIARINATQYETDYDFNRDLYDFTNQLNDGHTLWYPFCYTTFQSILPAPIVLFGDEVYIVPDSDQLFDQFVPDFANYFEARGFDWKRLAGAKVVRIGDHSARDYIDNLSRTDSGKFLDHNIRVNSVVSSYQLRNGAFSQRLGDVATSEFIKQTDLRFSVIPRDSPSGLAERVFVPFVAYYHGAPFSDGPSFWNNNCIATDKTNGVDKRLNTGSASMGSPREGPLDPAVGLAVELDLPLPFVPNLPPNDGGSDVMQSFVLPGNRTGVMFIGTFEGDLNQFPVDVEAAVNEFKSSGVTNLLIDVTNNPGGLVCNGLFLHQFLAGTEVGLPGFQSTTRANPLAQKIVNANIAQGLDSKFGAYSPDNWLLLNGSRMPLDFQYNDPSVPLVINGRQDPTSQRFADQCTPKVTMPATPPFDLSNIVIVGNGNCASTCAIFTTVMFERHKTRIVTFGGHPDQPIEYKGMSGTQVMEWAILDTEIKTAGLKDDPLAPPDLLVSANMRHNWRTAYSFIDEDKPIAYLSEPSEYRFQYTAETYNNPQNVWTFIEKQFFG